MIHIEDAIIQLFLSDATITSLVGEAVWRGQIPEDEQFPCIYFQKSNRGLIRNLSGYTPAFRPSVMFGYGAHDAETAAKIQAAVEDVLKRQQQKIELEPGQSIVIESCLWQDGKDFGEDQASGLWHLQDLWIIQYHEEVE